MQMIVKNGRVVDPENFHADADIYIDGGKIVDVKPWGKVISTGKTGFDESKKEKLIFKHQASTAEPEGEQIIDASGCIVVPGLIDMHVHLREPGEEYKETIETGIRAAAAGGFTSICCMPNTRPVNDNSQVSEFIIQKSKQFNSVRVYPVAAISMGLAGNELCEYWDLKDAGAVAVSDDGKPVIDSLLMRRALEYSKSVGIKVISHCEELSLSAGVMNEGPLATRIGLAGIPNAAETIMVIRDITLCELTGVPIHIAHVSTHESVRAIREAKSRGIPVTAETAPHYFTLTEDAVREYNTHAKMNPPLRSAKDRGSICAALSDGTIDVIATDHAPHSILEKDVEFDFAANGIIGLETSLGLGLKLVDEGILSIEALIEKMSINPAKILGLPCGLSIGNPADLTIIDPSQTYKYYAHEGYSMSRNTPFNGWEFKGKVLFTIVGGNAVFKA